MRLLGRIALFSAVLLALASHSRTSSVGAARGRGKAASAVAALGPASSPSRPAAAAALRNAPAPILPGAAGLALHSGGVTARFTEQGLTLSLPGPRKEGWGLRWGLAGVVLPAPIPEGPLPGRVNRLVGAPSSWTLDQSAYSRVRYGGIREGVDLVLESRPRGVEYSFHAAPGADLRDLRLKYEGALEVRVPEDGATLEVVTGHGVLKEEGLLCYQDTPGGRRSVDARYRRIGPAEYTVELGPVDETLAVVIDPVISWSTYVGGADPNGGNGQDGVDAIAVGSDGFVYVAGWATTSDFPLGGGFDTTLALTDAFVAKMDPATSSLVWSTFLGGSSYDFGRAIAVDAHDNVYVAGETMSSDFPVPGGFDAALGGSRDGFVTKIVATGSAIAWSSYLGGSFDDYPAAVGVDGAGNVLVAGNTESPDFPLVAAFDASYGGFAEGFVAKVDASGLGLLWSSYLGGSAVDAVGCLAVDGRGGLIVGGMTQSSDFPASAGVSATLSGNQDGFVTRIRADGAAPLVEWSTYLGGSQGETVASVAVDVRGNVYVAGQTESLDFPLQGAFDAARGFDMLEGFVTKIDNSGAALSWSSYLGGDGPDSCEGIAVDTDGRVYVVGATASADFPLVNPLDPVLGNGGPGYDAYLAVIHPSGGSLSFGTYLGGSDMEFVAGIGFDRRRNRVYVAGQTFSSDFPTPGGFDAVFGGMADGFVTRIDAGPPW